MYNEKMSFQEFLLCIGLIACTIAFLVMCIGLEEAGAEPVLIEPKAVDCINYYVFDPVPEAEGKPECYITEYGTMYVVDSETIERRLQCTETI